MGIYKRMNGERKKGEGGHEKKEEKEEGRESEQRGEGERGGGRRGRRSALALPSPRLAGQILKRHRCRRRRRRSGPRSSRSAAGGGETREGGARRGCGEGELFHQRKEDWLHPKPVRMQTRALALVGWGAGERGGELGRTEGGVGKVGGGATFCSFHHISSGHLPDHPSSSSRQLLSTAPSDGPQLSSLTPRLSSGAQRNLSLSINFVLPVMRPPPLASIPALPAFWQEG